MKAFNCLLLILCLFVSNNSYSVPLLSLGDINSDGSQDIAVLAAGTAIVKDAASGALIKAVKFNGGTSPYKFITVPDLNGNGAPELLVLDNGATKTELRDSLSGVLLSNASFTANYAYVDVAVVPDQDGNGVPELALLGKHTSKGYVKVETRDALTGNLVAITSSFSNNCNPRQLLVLPDVDTNGKPEFAVLCADADTVNKVEIRNSNGALLRNIWLNKWFDHPQMALLDDLNGNGSAELAILRVQPKYYWVDYVTSMQVQIVDVLTGKTIKTMAFNSSFIPVKLVVVPDMTGNGAAELALLGRVSEEFSRGVIVELHDAATGALVKNVWFDPSFLPQDLVTLADLNGNGAMELGMLGFRKDNKRSVFIKDASTGSRLNVVAFDEVYTKTKMLAAGESETCGLKTDGRVACWGWDKVGPVGKFRQISMSAYSRTFCGIKNDGSVVCGGESHAGNFSQISAGNYHVCGVKTDGFVACWGDNTYGESNMPYVKFTQVSAGDFYTCGIKTDGRVMCWGDSYAGVTTPPTGTFSQISAGPLHICGVRTNGRVACWGDDEYGQSEPPSGTFSQVSSGDDNVCGVRTDGRVACWGGGEDGENYPPAGKFSQVAAGRWHTCGVKTNGSVACWGGDYGGSSTPPAGW